MMKETEPMATDKGAAERRRVVEPDNQSPKVA